MDPKQTKDDKKLTINWSKMDEKWTENCSKIDKNETEKIGSMGFKKNVIESSDY